MAYEPKPDTGTISRWARPSRRPLAKTTPFGGRVAQGILTLAISNGQQNQLGIVEGTTLALLGIDRIRFTGPVRLGDTVHTAMTNQKGETVMRKRA